MSDGLIWNLLLVGMVAAGLIGFLAWGAYIAIDAMLTRYRRSRRSSVRRRNGRARRLAFARGN